MPLYVARHAHTPERCPARDPAAGSFLLQHLAEPTARQHGVRIRSEAVLDGAHTLLLIAEAPDPARLEAFLAPFAQAGGVEVFPASACASVVARQHC